MPETIPCVTVDDLSAFHHKHFSSNDFNPTTAATILSSSATGNEAATHVHEEYNRDDDLGYYPDGVRRTLTDDQIKIFRHSEIHRLLREKRIAEEEEEDDDIDDYYDDTKPEAERSQQGQGSGPASPSFSNEGLVYGQTQQHNGRPLGNDLEPIEKDRPAEDCRQPNNERTPLNAYNRRLVSYANP
ncbi:hypothetical protein FQN57_005449 [Myotisia sp. PD_48]|nr:hypothetical protein FQN57_005449 [Myotisia sp. PD_48]